MSGFVAVINTDDTPIERGLLETLMKALYFRGPDRQQQWIDGSVGLAHTLFITTDEAYHENQPASLDGKTWITGSIRVDAREELVNKLGMQRKIRLAETPDSHLILHAYRYWGEECLEHILGDYSFALWDATERKLFCARDRFGMRQLCYAQLGNSIIVSNSIHCILQHPNVSNRLSRAAMGDFLLFGDHRWGSRSLTSFADIKAVEPAHYLVFKQQTLKIGRYWDIPVRTPLLRYRRESEYIEHFKELFETAVSDRLRGGKVVISLSGGMDSASIAAVVRQLQREGKEKTELEAVTVLFDSIHPSDERYFVDLVSRHLDIPTHYLDGGDYSLFSPTVQTTCPLELYQPQLWLESDLYAMSKGRVLLNGEAGDELLVFSSLKNSLCDTHILKMLIFAFKLRFQYGAFPAMGTGLSRTLKSLRKGSQSQSQLFPYPQWINPDLEDELDLKNRWSQWNDHQRTNSAHRHPSVYSRMTEPDWNCDDYYMNCGFTLPENRSPFLDSRLLDFVMSIPALPWMFKKHILRAAMSGALPKSILRRPKTALGSIHDSLIKEADPVSLGNWKQNTQLSQYVDVTRLPALSSTPGREDESYVNLRPLLLSRWLEGIANE